MVGGFPLVVRKEEDSSRTRTSSPLFANLKVAKSHLAYHAWLMTSSLGERIKQRRLALGWTLDRLAAEAKISKGFLSDLENGNRKTAGGEYLNNIARALGVSLDFLVSGGGNLPQGEKVQIPASLAAFAQQAGLSFSQTMMLLQLRRQIVAFRSDRKSDDLEEFDWKPFYEDLKAHLK